MSSQEWLPLTAAEQEKFLADQRAAKRRAHLLKVRQMDKAAAAATRRKYQSGRDAIRADIHRELTAEWTAQKEADINALKQQLSATQQVAVGMGHAGAVAVGQHLRADAEWTAAHNANAAVHTQQRGQTAHAEVKAKLDAREHAKEERKRWKEDAKAQAYAMRKQLEAEQAERLANAPPPPVLSYDPSQVGANQKTQYTADGEAITIERFDRPPPGSRSGGTAGSGLQQPYARSSRPSGWVSAEVHRSQQVRDRAWAEHKQRVERERASVRGAHALSTVFLQQQKIEMEKSLAFIDATDRFRKLEIAKQTAAASEALNPLTVAALNNRPFAAADGSTGRLVGAGMRIATGQFDQNYLNRAFEDAMPELAAAAADPNGPKLLSAAVTAPIIAAVPIRRAAPNAESDKYGGNNDDASGGGGDISRTEPVDADSGVGLDDAALYADENLPPAAASATGESPMAPRMAPRAAPQPADQTLPFPVLSAPFVSAFGTNYPPALKPYPSRFHDSLPASHPPGYVYPTAPAGETPPSQRQPPPAPVASAASTAAASAAANALAGAAAALAEREKWLANTRSAATAAASTAAPPPKPASPPVAAAAAPPTAVQPPKSVFVEDANDDGDADADAAAPTQAPADTAPAAEAAATTAVAVDNWEAQNAALDAELELIEQKQREVDALRQLAAARTASRAVPAQSQPQPSQSTAPKSASQSQLHPQPQPQAQPQTQAQAQAQPPTQSAVASVAAAASSDASYQLTDAQRRQVMEKLAEEAALLVQATKPTRLPGMVDPYPNRAVAVAAASAAAAPAVVPAEPVPAPVSVSTPQLQPAPLPVSGAGSLNAISALADTVDGLSATHHLDALLNELLSFQITNLMPANLSDDLGIAPAPLSAEPFSSGLLASPPPPPPPPVAAAPFQSQHRAAADASAAGEADADSEESETDFDASDSNQTDGDGDGDDSAHTDVSSVQTPAANRDRDQTDPSDLSSYLGAAHPPAGATAAAAAAAVAAPAVDTRHAVTNASAQATAISRLDAEMSAALAQFKQSKPVSPPSATVDATVSGPAPVRSGNSSVTPTRGIDWSRPTSTRSGSSRRAGSHSDVSSVTVRTNDTDGSGDDSELDSGLDETGAKPQA